MWTIQHVTGICLQLVMIVLLVSISTEGYCLVNVALGKPAYQPNTAYAGFPELAVDGDNNNRYYKRSCTYTGGQADAYWQVDLQADYVIWAVTITNRADDFVWRLHDFEVDVYTTNPIEPEATFEKCFSFPGRFGPVTRTLYCDSIVKGRYVRISKNAMDTNQTAEDALTLCEVAVHAHVGSGNCDPKPVTPSEFIPYSNLYLDVTDFKEFSGSLMSCMVECFRLPMCDGFNFNGTGHGVGLCELIPIKLVGMHVTKSGWTFYNATCN